MPVTFSPAKHSAESFVSVQPHTSVSILSGACYREFQKSDKVLQSSFHGGLISDIVPTSNGFVNTVKEAYNRHHALIIRPDDVWLAILVQFSSFVNANAEALRSQFVRHQGKKELEVAFENWSMVDFGLMARLMTKAINENVTDPALRTWILPDFTTTTPNDTTVCSIAMIATMKQYFSYKCSVACGIPRVTLEGERADWEKILVRLERLKEYGIQTIAWYHLLFPVISRFVQAFDAPDSAENLDFWGKVVHREGGGSGPSYLCGWITAFCVFNEAGKWLGKNIVMPDETAMPLKQDVASLSSAEFFSTYTAQFKPRRDLLKLDDTPYHRVDTTDIPPGYLEVDVLLDDNGNKFNTLMVAGQIGMRISSSGDNALSPDIRDTVAPVAGWWMLTKKPRGGSSKDQL